MISPETQKFLVLHVGEVVSEMVFRYGPVVCFLGLRCDRMNDRLIF
jgi:hypothetical protein